jgi:hypothetical protein
MRNLKLVFGVSILIPLLALLYPTMSAAKEHSHCDALNPIYTSIDTRQNISNIKSSEAFRFCKQFLKLESILPDYTPVRTKGQTEESRLDEIVSNYAWHESRVLRAYLEMYYATKDVHFLEKMIEDIDVIQNDSTLPATNGMGYGWPVRSKGDAPYTETPPYTDINGSSVDEDGFLVDAKGKKYYVRDVVHSGLLLYPIARLVQILKEEPTLNSQLAVEYQGRVDSYLALIINVINTHNNRFCYGSQQCGLVDTNGDGIFEGTVTNNVKPNIDEAFYYINGTDSQYKKSLRGWNLPTNQQVAMGSVFAILWGIEVLDSRNSLSILTNNYGNMAKGLRRAFMRKIETKVLPNSNKKYKQWGYWWGESAKHFSTKYEDNSHAFIDIEFLIELRRQGLNIRNFTWPFILNFDDNIVYADVKESDVILQQFANTFSDIMYQHSNKYVSGRVDGSFSEAIDWDDLNSLEKGGVRNMFGFLDLAEWDNDFVFISSEIKTYNNTPSAINNAAIPNKVYSIVKCAYDLNVNTEAIPADRILLHGLAKLIKWSVFLRDNDNDSDRKIRCNATKSNPDQFYTTYMKAYVNKLEGL